MVWTALLFFSSYVAQFALAFTFHVPFSEVKLGCFFSFSVSILPFLLILFRIWRLRDEWAGLTSLSLLIFGSRLIMVGTGSF